MKRKMMATFIVLFSFLLGITSEAYASEGKSSIQFYMENVGPEDEDEIISDKEEIEPEKLPEAEKDTSGKPQTLLPQTNYTQSRIMVITGSLILVVILLIIKERRKKNEKK